MPDSVPDVPGDRAWWSDAVIYQVYARSFRDENNDGEGDLAGVIRGLPYIADLGVDAIWLNPFYPSPLRDGGYDISDYRSVDPRYGTLDDVDRLMSAAHDLGLRVIVDIVPNHTSSEHPWFAAALAAPQGSPERARYVFRDGRGADGDEPPTNWRSVFGSGAWTRVPDGQWYLHLFDAGQPDLNWDNPEVRSEFESILRFWFDRGVDGIRIDVAHGLAKDLAEPLRDLDPELAETYLLNPVADLDHPYWNRDGVHDIYRRWRAIMDDYQPARMGVAEAWLADARLRADYTRPDELHQAFTFDLMWAEWGAEAFRAAVDDSLEANAVNGAPSVWVLANHDTIREATRFAIPDGMVPETLRSDPNPPRLDPSRGLRRARAAALFMLGLPGSAYIYQGEELGLPERLDLPRSAAQDPQTLLAAGTYRGRDGCRIPLPWKADSPNLGFSEGARSWLPIPADWSPLAVDAQLGRPDSTLELYRAALALRRGVTGELHWVEHPENAGLLHYRRDGGWECLVNFGDEPVPLPAGATILAHSDPRPGAEVVAPDSAVWFRR